MRILFSTIAKVLGITYFRDNFYQRSNTTTGLGTSTSGEKWTAKSGLINVISGKAKASTIPTKASPGSDYPISTVKMAKPNVDIKITDTNQGSSAAIWVQSADEWWMVNVRSVLTEIPGTPTYGVVGSNYGIVGDNYGATGSNYVKTGDNYGIVGYSTTNPQGSTTSDYYYYYSTPNYGYNLAAFFNYSTYQTTKYGYGTTTTSHTNYFAGFYYGANFGVTYSRYVNTYKATYTRYSWGATGYNSSTTYGTGYKFNSALSNYDYVVTGTYYTYKSGVVGNNSDLGSSPGTFFYYYYGTDANYGDTGDNYGVAGTNYGVVGSNYGVIGSNYGQTGTNATTYSFAQYLDISKSVASVVSTVTSALISTTQTIGSFFVSLSGNQITARAYSDTNLVTQIGSDLVYTATGAVINTEFGISISPSEYQQSDIIGSSVEISVNA